MLQNLDEDPISQKYVKKIFSYFWFYGLRHLCNSSAMLV